MKTRNDIKNALQNVGDFFYHFKAPVNKDAPYGVWAEDGQSNMHYGDDTALSQALTGTIDYFTRLDSDEIPWKIQEALSHAGIIWSLNSVQYEDDTELIHWEWVWEVDEWHT